jgi:hypothetical protein
MATTPNYGWVTPAPTDFVTDLPADFEVFADAVDADLAGLLGGTTGQVLVKNSGTDHDYDFGTDPVSDIVTTAGDLLYGSAADTVVRLGIGTAGQFLQVNSGATAPEWTTLSGAGFVRIGGSTVSGVSNVVYNDVFNSTYRVYKIILNNDFNTGGSGSPRILLRASGSNATSNYRTNGFTSTSSGQTFSGDSGSTSSFSFGAGFGTNPARNIAEITLFNPFLAQRTGFMANWSGISSDDSFRNMGIQMGFNTNQTSYDGFQFEYSSSTFSGSIDIYGLGI